MADRIGGWTLAELEEFFTPAVQESAAVIGSEPYAHADEDAAAIEAWTPGGAA